ncbi:MAG: hypothetical protein K1X57_14920 [Gemmataceae bacterium]|nr:hypothetical protein [Gemmataceae bacterium]
MAAAESAQRTFVMLENESLWQTATRVHGALTDAGIDYAIAGGVAVCLHGYRRNTVDIDLIIRPEQADDFRVALAAAEFNWNSETREMRSPSGVAVQVLLAGESEGPGQPARFPSPDDATCLAHIEGLVVLSLAALIQSKIACGLGNLRRTHKDFADVVELIAIHQLDGSFSRFLHESVRGEYRELVRRVRETGSG